MYFYVKIIIALSVFLFNKLLSAPFEDPTQDLQFVSYVLRKVDYLPLGTAWVGGHRLNDEDQTTRIQRSNQHTLVLSFTSAASIQDIFQALLLDTQGQQTQSALKISTDDLKTSLFLKEVAEKLQEEQKKILYFVQAFQPVSSLPQARWVHTTRAIISQLKAVKRATADLASGNAQRQSVESQSVQNFSIQPVTEKPFFLKFWEKKPRHRQCSNTWGEAFQSLKSAEIPFTIFPACWVERYRLKNFTVAKMVGIDYCILQAFMPAFKDVEVFVVDNDSALYLKRPVKLVFQGFHQIKCLNLSYDPKLYVNDYKDIVYNYPSEDHSILGVRKLIVGPLFQSSLKGNTLVPSSYHPLLFDNTGLSPSLSLRTQKIFSSLPTRENLFVGVEFVGHNIITGIDFVCRPVSSGVLESILQARIHKSFDPIVSWDERFTWSNKFALLEYIDLSYSNVDDLSVLSNLKNMAIINLRDTALSSTRAIEALHRLKGIQFTFQPHNTMRANMNYWRMNFYNMLKQKHNFTSFSSWITTTVLAAIILRFFTVHWTLTSTD